MTSFEIFLAIVISVAALLQVVALFLIFTTVKKLESRVREVLAAAKPILSDLSEGSRSVRTAVETASAEVRATMAGVRATTDELRHMLTSEASEVRHSLRKASRLLEYQAEEISHGIDTARRRIGDVTEGMDRAVLDPVRQITALMVGVRKAMEFFIVRKRLQPAEAGPNGDDVGHP